jgi:chloride channel protein, CIC family
MTLDYTVIIPMTITVALSYGVRTMIHRQSIYTEKLARRGHDIPAALQANFYHLKKTRDVMDTRFVAVPAAGTIEDFARIASEQPEVSCFLVEGPEGLVGFLTRDSALRPSLQREKPVTLADLADRAFVTVGEDMPLLDVMTRLRAAGASVALVTDGTGTLSGGSVRGLVTKDRIASAVIEGMELFSEAPSTDGHEQRVDGRERSRSSSDNRVRPTNGGAATPPGS